MQRARAARGRRRQGRCEILGMGYIPCLEPCPNVLRLNAHLRFVIVPPRGTGARFGVCLVRRSVDPERTDKIKIKTR